VNESVAPCLVSPGCLSPEETELVAADEMAPEALRRHATDCAVCGHSVSEARLNQLFLRELAADWRAAGEVTHVAGPAADPRRHDALTDYRLLHEIHRGAQGVVHRAVHLPTGRPAAVKIMHVGSLRRRMRMQREASLAAALRHPGIVTLHDCGELADGGYAIAMELVDGEMLDAWAQRLRGTESEPRTVLRRIVRLVALACDAVQHAHTRGVIHRDLKPSNILVDANDQPHILDFGVARRATEDVSAERVTLTGEIACTLAYAVPEQVSGSAAMVDTRSDVYALRVVLYELVTGHLPYPTDGAFGDAIDAIRTRDPAPPRLMAPAVDADLETVMLKALAKEPERRYQSAAALHSDLLHWLDGEAVDARRASRWYVLRKSMHRYRGPIAVAAAICVAIVGGTIAAIVSTSRSATASELASAEARRSRDEARRWEAVAEVLHEIIPAADPQFGAYGFGPMHQAVANLSDRLEAGLFVDDPFLQAAIHSAIGDVCADRGSLRLAEVQYRVALRVMLSHPNPGREQVAAARRRLAALLVRRNSLHDAERQMAAAIDSLRASPINVDEELSAALRTRAEIALQADDLDGAEALCREALALPVAETATTGARRTLARTLLARGAVEAAHDEATRALADTLCSLSDLHPEIPDAIETYAATLAEGDRERAQALGGVASVLRARTATFDDLQELIGLKAALLGPEHVDIVETMSSIAYIRQHAGDAIETRRAAERAIEFARCAHGDNTMVVADLLGIHYASCLQLSDEEPCLRSMEQRLAILRPILTGRDDVHLAVALRECAHTASVLGRNDVADVYWAEVIAFTETRLGPIHRELARAISRHAEYLACCRDKTPTALVAMDRAIAMLDHIDDEPSFHIAVMRAGRASFLAVLGELDESACELDRVIQICDASPEAALVRGRLFDSVYESMVLHGNPECCVKLWELRDGPYADGTRIGANSDK